MKTARNRPRRRPRNLANLVLELPEDSYSTTKSPQTSPIINRPCRIHEKSNIFIGSQFDATNEETLAALKITHILSVQLDDLPTRCKAHIGAGNHKFIKMQDTSSANILSKLDEAISYLDSHQNSEGNTLIHCKMGISRSATICAAFLMKKYGMTFDQSLGQLRAGRPQVGPNFGFLGQLKIYEAQIGAAM